MDSEKLTINVTPVDLGKMDVLVAQGVFTNRADLIRTAIRKELDQHDTMVKETIVKGAYWVGIQIHSKKELEQLRAQGKKLHMRTVGMIKLTNDVTPELADAVFESLTVRGILRAPKPVLERLAPKIEYAKKR